MRCADVGRAKTVPLRSEPAFGQRPENVSESMSNDGRHVLQEHVARSNVAKDASDVRPQPSLVVGAALASGDGEGLAGETCADDIHASTPASAVEGGKVVPDRARIQPPCFHLANQERGGIGFPLHETDGAVGRDGERDTQFESADAGTKSQATQLRASLAALLALNELHCVRAAAFKPFGCDMSQDV